MSKIPAHLHADKTKDRKLSKKDEEEVERLMNQCIALLQIEKFPIKVELRQWVYSSFYNNIEECVYLEVEKELIKAGYSISYKNCKTAYDTDYKTMIIDNPKSSFSSSSSLPPAYSE